MEKQQQINLQIDPLKMVNDMQLFSNEWYCLLKKGIVDGQVKEPKDLVGELNNSQISLNDNFTLLRKGLVALLQENEQLKKNGAKVVHSHGPNNIVEYTTENQPKK